MSGLACLAAIGGCRSAILDLNSRFRRKQTLAKSDPKSELRTKLPFPCCFVSSLLGLVTDDLNRMGSALFDIARGISNNLGRELTQEDVHSKYWGVSLLGAFDSRLVALQVFFTRFCNLYVPKPSPLKSRN